MCTELISNNAAAALNIPVALSMAREMKVNCRLAPKALCSCLTRQDSFFSGHPTDMS